MEATVATVLLYATITAVATGLGALPFFFTTRLGGRFLGLANAAAAGLMLAASFQLISDGTDRSGVRTLVGVLLGVALIVAADRWLERRDTPDIGELHGADAVKALLILGVMTVHSFAEGVGVGVAFGGGGDFGAFISVAIAVHNIPEGLAISLVLVPRGTSPLAAAGWSVFSSLPQPLMAVPAFLFVQIFEPFLPVGLGLAAGAMIWMAHAELIPDALDEVPAEHAAVALTVAVAAMVGFQTWLGGV